MMSFLVRISAVLVWSIIAGYSITAYLDKQQLLDSSKSINVAAIKKRLDWSYKLKQSLFAMKADYLNSVPAYKQGQLPRNNGKNVLDHLPKAITSLSKKDQYLYILTKLNELQLPQELALIPIIESEYNSKAVSPKGAGGLWQLMPKTAGDFGLSDDDRFQLEPSTLAALRYLKQLYKKFGKWELAIAAYNAGSSRVEKALSKNPNAKSVQELNLPEETINYVNRFYQIIAALYSR